MLLCIDIYYNWYSFLGEYTIFSSLTNWWVLFCGRIGCWKSSSETYGKSTRMAFWRRQPSRRPKMLSSFGISILYPWTLQVLFSVVYWMSIEGMLSYHTSWCKYISFSNLSMHREASKGKLKVFWVTMKMMWCLLISLVIACRLLFLM